MSEPTNSTEAPASVATPEKKMSSDEILKRSAEAKPAQEESAPVEKSDIEIPEQMFDRSELDKIRDPFVKQQVEALLTSKEKDMLRGMNEKFQQIAKIRKELEEKQSSLQESDSWTQERLYKAMQNPEFMRLVQAEAERRQAQMPPENYDGTAEEWSNLSDAEQRRIKALEEKMAAFDEQQTRLQIEQADKKIAEKLYGYDPKAVDKFQSELIDNRYTQSDIREAIGKSLLFDEAVERAYQLGLQDRNADLSQKMEATTNLNGTNMPTSDPIPEKTVDERTGRRESTRSHFARIAMEKLKSMGKPA